MNPINHSPMRAAAAAVMPANNPDASQASAITIAATNFTYYHVLGDGDCLFRAMHMGLSDQPGIEATSEQVMEMRQTLADYVSRHQSALIAHPAFEGSQGLQNLYGLLLTPGQWNHKAGDLVPPLLAQVYGQPVAVLQPVHEGASYNVRQVFPAENPTLPPGAAHNGGPAICLAHINGKHYGYLEQRYLDVLSGALAQSRNVAAFPEQAAEQAPRGLSLPASQEPSSTREARRRKFDEIAPESNGHKIKKKGKRTPKPSDAQTHDLAQLWRANPSWSLVKITMEYNRLNPGVNASPQWARKAKALHPDLQGLTLGSYKKQKILSDAQEKEAVQLWLHNPEWSEKKVADALMARNPGLKITKGITHSIKGRHWDLQKFGVSGEASKRKLSHAQEQSLAKLWRENPEWGQRRVTKEFMLRNPGVNITKSLACKLKERHPDLKHSGVGAEPIVKKLSDEQTESLVNLWRQNPCWGEKKITQAFLERNPGLKMTFTVPRNLKYHYPDLQSFGSAYRNKPLTKEQEKAFVELWLDNPTLQPKQIVHKFNARNPTLDMPQTLAISLKEQHPDLAGQPLMNLPYNAPPLKKRAHVEKQLNLLAKQMQSIGPLDQADEAATARYQHLYQQFDHLQQRLININNRIDALASMLGSQPLPRRNASLINTAEPHQALANESRLDQALFADEFSQQTGPPLAELSGFDNLSMQQGGFDDDFESDVLSQGIFAPLPDSENFLSEQNSIPSETSRQDILPPLAGLTDFDKLSDEPAAFPYPSESDTDSQDIFAPLKDVADKRNQP